MFEENRANVPLAERLRPRTIDEVIGQKHLLGASKPMPSENHRAKASDVPNARRAAGTGRSGA